MKATFFLQRIMASNSLIWGYTSWLFNRTPRRLLKITLLLMALLFCGNVRAQEIAYTLNCEKNKDNSNYAAYYDVTINGVGWNAPGNQSIGEYWRIGGKSLSNGNRTITSKNSIQSAISKVVLTHNGTSSTAIKVNSISLIVASDASFNQIIDQQELNDLSITTSNGTIEINPSASVWSANSYYKFIINVTNTSNNNGGLDLVKIVFYEAIAVTPTESYTVTFNPGTGACETSSLTESNPGAGVTLPTATSPCPSDWAFAGWSTTEITAETTTAPQLYAEGSTYHPMANETLYAVYKKQP